ncbi:MAG: lipoyl(octanoyl) transferase LipB [Elusimicrobia bacterium]|nr:lipoyl(octanoyl) transferase LipB [Elusimicrobiota bacterium]
MTVSAPALLTRDLGLIGYDEAWALQRALAAERADGRGRDVLLLLEHPPVYTRGTSSRGEGGPLPHPVRDAERGGQTTYHGPGQLVAYPIVHLKERGLTVGAWLRGLESAVIAVLAGFGLEGERVAGATGVWCRGRKTASIGVAVKGWVAYHGLALNAELDLAPFAAIRPCGFAPEVMTSLTQLLGRRVGAAELKAPLAAALEAELSHAA